MLPYDRLRKIASNQPYPILFATISGAHLYGFASPDSDFDLRGVHILPLEEVVGLNRGEETVEVSKEEDSLELDLVSHDVEKFFHLLLKRNGYVLEQLYSPLIVTTTPEHERLKEIAKSCITKYHAHHYLGFADTQWKLFQKEETKRVKPLLYVFRVLLTGIHLMRTGIIEANLEALSREAGLSYLDNLIGLKRSTKEKVTVPEIQLEFITQEYERLRSLLESASTSSQLPEAPTAKPQLNELLISLRKKIGWRSL